MCSERVFRLLMSENGLGLSRPSTMTREGKICAQARTWVSGDLMSCTARRFACEAFAQEPIHHRFGLNLKLG